MPLLNGAGWALGRFAEDELEVVGEVSEGEGEG